MQKFEAHPNYSVIAGPSSSKCLEIPFYPAFSVESRDDGVTVYWFEKAFSQVSYGNRPERGKNACVLIVLLTASKLAQNLRAIHMKRDEKVNYMTIKCFAEGILQGIEAYSNLMEGNRLRDPNLTIPEAYRALGPQVANIHEWKSFIFAANMADNLHNYLLEGIHAWNFKSLAKKHVLFVILIADARSVLMMIDQIEDKITFIDSHPHSSTHGACVATAELSDIRAFCRWICKLFKDLYNSSPQCFELSYFQVKAR